MSLMIQNIPMGRSNASILKVPTEITEMVANNCSFADLKSFRAANTELALHLANMFFNKAHFRISTNKSGAERFRLLVRTSAKNIRHVELANMQLRGVIYTRPEEGSYIARPQAITHKEAQEFRKYFPHNEKDPHLLELLKSLQLCTNLLSISTYELYFRGHFTYSQPPITSVEATEDLSATPSVEATEDLLATPSGWSIYECPKNDLLKGSIGWDALHLLAKFPIDGIHHSQLLIRRLDLSISVWRDRSSEQEIESFANLVCQCSYLEHLRFNVRCPRENARKFAHSMFIRRISLGVGGRRPSKLVSLQFHGSTLNQNVRDHFRLLKASSKTLRCLETPCLTQISPHQCRQYIGILLLLPCLEMLTLQINGYEWSVEGPEVVKSLLANMVRNESEYAKILGNVKGSEAKLEMTVVSRAVIEKQAKSIRQMYSDDKWLSMTEHFAGKLTANT